uniref:Estrogen sulfotransferase, isoform 2 n=1 Tax=Caligus clemensi TaxID=344056 RepID=C1C1N2_CALCM|nr:Estrogen sulfotransferase, isoform 2 [Caligus clemensi]
MSTSLTLDPIPNEEREERAKLWTGPQTAMVDMVFRDEFYMPKRYLEIDDEIKDLEIRPDDLFIISYPKAGTTWSQEMVWQLKQGVDFEGGKTAIPMRVPFLEVESLVQRVEGAPDKGVEFVKDMPSPRIVKSHLRAPYLPKDLLSNGKVIYVTRNPKDVCVSFYHHEMLLNNHKYTGSFEQFADIFLEGKVAYGSYWAHLKFGLEIKENSNVLFVRYEDMKKDICHEMKRVIDFMDWPEPSEEKMEALREHLNFSSCKKNPALNFNPDGDINDQSNTRQFIRKGIVGDWKNFFSPELSKRFDEKMESYPDLADFDIPYEM